MTVAQLIEKLKTLPHEQQNQQLGAVITEYYNAEDSMGWETFHNITAIQIRKECS